MDQSLPLEERRKKLEEEFFLRENQRLLDNLRRSDQMKRSKEELSKACGIHNEAILEKLIKLEIGAETVVAIALVPLVEVVWADGYLDEREKEAVLKAAQACGLSRGTLGHELVEGWLARRPSSRLLETWKEYIREFFGQLRPEEANALKADLLERARAVADASGGFLGLTPRISQSEAAKLEELQKALE